MNEPNILVAEAMLGEEAEKFLSSDVGRYLVGRSRQEERAALDELVNVPPADAAAIQRLQNTIWLARSVRGWLVECVTAGRAAGNALIEAEAED